MAGSHVPKFGNWDGDNVPYTTYFENARKGKGGKMINPNDPEENPEAFAYRGYEDASINVSPVKTHLVETPQYNYGHCRNLSGVEDKSISGYSVNQPTVSRRTSDAKKNKNDRGNIFVPPSPNRLKNSRNSSDDLSYYSSASVPKFGAWDEKDPKSGEGFTVIFNKVKEEKQIAAAKFPIVQPQPNMPSSHKRNAKSKVCLILANVNTHRLRSRFLKTEQIYLENRR
ncbi:RPM1-interacting protein 4-like isoform X2 [Nicotiana tabacum]|uniref:RPM1-interacting protein 4-like isoform X2 n=1 Tax=Nicotiana tabacum TaxID=4097 RepID=A0AC58SAK9_TOBAC